MLPDRRCHCMVGNRRCRGKTEPEHMYCFQDFHKCQQRHPDDPSDWISYLSAATTGDYETMILWHRYDPDVVTMTDNETGWYAVQYAIAGDHVDIVTRLIAQNIQQIPVMDILRQVVREGKLDFIKSILTPSWILISQEETTMKSFLQELIMLATQNNHLLLLTWFYRNYMSSFIRSMTNMKLDENILVVAIRFGCSLDLISWILSKKRIPWGIIYDALEEVPKTKVPRMDVVKVLILAGEVLSEDIPFDAIVGLLNRETIPWFFEQRVDFPPPCVNNFLHVLLTAPESSFKLVQWYLQTYGPIELSLDEKKGILCKAVAYNELDWLRDEVDTGLVVQHFEELFFSMLDGKKNHVDLAMWLLDQTPYFELSTAIIARVRTLEILDFFLQQSTAKLSYVMFISFLIFTSDVLDVTDFKWLLSCVDDFSEGGEVEDENISFRGGSEVDYLAVMNILIRSHHQCELFQWLMKMHNPLPAGILEDGQGTFELLTLALMPGNMVPGSQSKENIAYLVKENIINIKVLSGNGRTPLMQLCYELSTEFVPMAFFLIDLGGLDRTKDRQGKSVWDLLLPTLRNTRYEVCSEKYRALNELLKYLMVRQKMPTHILRVLNFNRVYTGTLQVGTRIRRNLVYLAASRDRVLQNINIPEETHDIINSFVGMNFQE